MTRRTKKKTKKKRKKKNTDTYNDKLIVGYSAFFTVHKLTKRMLYIYIYISIHKFKDR